jgi:phosphoglycerate dehydrogenase-like enzyme
VTTLLVLAHPHDRELAALDRLPGDVRVVAGDNIEAFAHAAPEADAILSWWGDRALLEQVFSRAPRVRWVHSAAAGVESLLFPALVESPVELTNARGAYSASLGEFAVAAMLFFAKDLRRMLRSQAAASWDQFDVELLAGRTLGIAGYGDIGRAAARLARPFGMRILALRRRPDRSASDPLIDAAYPPGRIREMLALSDHVLVAAPLTPSTRGLIGEAELAAMRPGAVLINVGRGPVVDEPALVAALERGRIRAALDVFETEPLPAGHPFWRLDNVLLSPHCADHHEGWRARSMEVFLSNFRRFAAGDPLENVVDKRAGY